jgi:hypothetical protein
MKINSYVMQRVIFYPSPNQLISTDGYFDPGMMPKTVPEVTTAVFFYIRHLNFAWLYPTDMQLCKFIYFS